MSYRATIGVLIILVLLWPPAIASDNPKFTLENGLECTVLHAFWVSDGTVANFRSRHKEILKKLPKREFPKFWSMEGGASVERKVEDPSTTKGEKFFQLVFLFDNVTADTQELVVNYGKKDVGDRFVRLELRSSGQDAKPQTIECFELFPGYDHEMVRRFLSWDNLPQHACYVNCYRRHKAKLAPGQATAVIASFKVPDDLRDTTLSFQNAVLRSDKAGILVTLTR